MHLNLGSCEIFRFFREDKLNVFEDSRKANSIYEISYIS